MISEDFMPRLKWLVTTQMNTTSAQFGWNAKKHVKLIV